MKQERVTFADHHPVEDTEKRTASVLIDNLSKRREARAHSRAVPALHPDFVSLAGAQAELDTVARKALPDIPAGHYAVDSLTGNNDLDFFRVDRPTEGRWAGRTFVKRVIGGKADSPVRGATARAALEAIEKAGPAEATKLYGQEIGRCGRCNRRLTDELSRQRGIGPDCYDQMTGAA